MNKIKKAFALIKSEVKCGIGGEAVIILMLSVMIICASVMTTAISKYIGTLIYLMNTNAQNSVKLISGGDDSLNFDEIKAFPEVEYGIEVSCYQESRFTLYAVSEELFDEELSFISKSNIDAEKNSGGDAVPLLVSEATKLEVGHKAKLSDGTQYEVVGIIGYDVQYLLFFANMYDKFAIALDNEQFTSLTPMLNPIMFTKLSGNTDKSEFKEKYSSSGFAVLDFDPIETLSTDFSNSITLSVIGITAFITSFFGVIINSYLVFCGRKRFYKTIMTIGGKTKLFLQSGTVIKVFQILISFAFSYFGLLFVNKMMGNDYFNLLSTLVSAALTLLVMTVTWFLNTRWFKKLSLTEN